MKKFSLFCIITAATFLPLGAFAASFPRDLYYGMRSDGEVKHLQEFLRGQSLYDGPVTGNFLSRTTDAVKKFQMREGISPVAGYFGPKTRARAITILGESSSGAPFGATVTVAGLIERLQFLQSELVRLQGTSSEVILPPLSPTPIPPPPALPSISFTKNPVILKSEFIGTRHQFGVRYPYRVFLDWEQNVAGTAADVSCSPEVKQATSSALGKAELYPVAGTSHACRVALASGNASGESADITLAAPSWVSASGYATSSFPAVETTSFKVGEFSLYNGTGASVQFGEFTVNVSDEMDSTVNRNHRVFFLLRDGRETTDTQISKNEFTFVATAPKTGEPYIAPLKLAFDRVLASGEEKTVSLWVEQLKYVRSGRLAVSATVIPTTDTSLRVEGGFSLALTKEPPL